jgi:5-methyltetrahydrofolate--homocysteine methyltransferase
LGGGGVSVISLARIGVQRSGGQRLAKIYQGIRPAPGYGCQPDHTEKTIFELLNVPAAAGIELTESCAMRPGSSVCGLYLAHPQARYFGVGRIGDDQLEEYATRK